MEPPRNFEKLFRQESKLLSEADANGRKEALEGVDVELPGSAGEPWIRFTPIDRVGLAFSGGGIRSATFNLGVLKALHELKLLKHVDYLSTVSGGGYIGAWWSAWRARVGRDFPEAQTSSMLGMGVTQAQMNREPAEVRHLREFSSFLSPRIGFFQSEMWNAVIAVLSAVLPAMVAASAVIALAFLVWLGVSSLILVDVLNMPLPTARSLQAMAGWLHIALPGPDSFKGWLTPIVLSLITVFLHIFLEVRWCGLGKAEEPPSKAQDGLVQGLLLAGVVAGIFVGWYLLRLFGCLDAVLQTGPHSWEWATSIKPPQKADFSFSPAFSPYLFAGPILWVGVVLPLLVLRLIVMRARRENAGSFVSILDRTLARLIGAALIFAALAALWLAGCWINYDGRTKLPAVGALLSGGGFALLRNWMGRLGPGKKGGVMDIVKPLIPQILAYVAIALWAIFIAALLAHSIKGDYFRWFHSPWFFFALALGIVLFALVFFDPAQVSMHSFYRNRLSRAYLGASNVDAISKRRIYAETNRQTDLRWRDDIELCALSPADSEVIEDRKLKENRVYAEGVGSTDPCSRVRPLHLICCAANDLGGDHLENLSRGSRSAVLSKFGYSIGDYWKSWKEEKEKKGQNHKTLGLGSAITASAAAFNSNMGSVSMTLGAAVTFLCTALNLRLGLWLPHPLSTKHGTPKLAGWLFFKEMFGLTNSGLRPPLYKTDNEADPPANQGTAPNQAKSNEYKPVAEDVHLSDGAHFENLGLYELVRRHCRYIIVSDCGTDPKVTFDDFGNAVRRIREDFGVEIEIDLSPLKPNEAQISKQHVAVGTICYDPRAQRKDTAVLLYFKPTLTGDEPCDITQYRTRNEAFPHESTGDQFYDEAQWESYRRLGEHATRSALRFVERMSKNDASSADAVFNGARWEWYQSPERREEKILELTARLTALERELQEAPADLVREMYPELGTLELKKPRAVDSAEETSTTLHFLMQMLQLMEDAWFAAYLETHWNDPNNLGWMNTFQRWAYTPSFRLWWPILKPMYGRKFRRFMEERLSLRDEDYPPTKDRVTERGRVTPVGVAGVAQTYWNRMYARSPSRVADKEVYSYDLELTDQSRDTANTCKVQAGLAFLDLSSNNSVASWRVDDFFVPPSLWGAGLGAKFLHKLLRKLKKKGVTHCKVQVEPVQEIGDVAVPWSQRTDVASRQQLNDLLAFYQRAQFTLLHHGNMLVRDMVDVVPEEDESE